MILYHFTKTPNWKSSFQKGEIQSVYLMVNPNGGAFYGEYKIKIEVDLNNLPQIEYLPNHPGKLPINGYGFNVQKKWYLVPRRAIKKVF